MVEFSCSGKIVISALCALLVVMVGTAAEASTFHQIWQVKSDYTSPDKLRITVNGESQAPTFFAQKNDIIILQVTNGLLTRNLRVLLIGVGQNGNRWLGVTQNPTVPGETFRKEFAVDKPGKYICDYYGILEREGALYISIHRKPEPFFNGYDQSISEKLKSMVHSSRIMKKRTVAVRFQAENPGMNYQGVMLPSPRPSPSPLHFSPNAAPPRPPTGSMFSLKVIILIGASSTLTFTISMVVNIKIRNCICCPKYALRF